MISKHFIFYHYYLPNLYIFRHTSYCKKLILLTPSSTTKYSVFTYPLFHCHLCHFLQTVKDTCFTKKYKQIVYQLLNYTHCTGGEYIQQGIKNRIVVQTHLKNLFCFFFISHIFVVNSQSHSLRSNYERKHISVLL